MVLFTLSYVLNTQTYSDGKSENANHVLQVMMASPQLGHFMVNIYGFRSN